MSRRDHLPNEEPAAAPPLTNGYPDYMDRMDSQPADERVESGTHGRHGLPDSEPFQPESIDSSSPTHDADASQEFTPAAVPSTSGQPASETPPTSQQDERLPNVEEALAEIHARFDRVEQTLTASTGTVERNYEQSLMALRDRAVAAESGVTQSLLRPLARQLASLIDRAELETSKQQADPWVLTASLIDELLDILEDFGVETIDCNAGMEVDKARHRVVKSTAERINQDDTLQVVERIRHGFELSGYVIRPAEVVAEWVQAPA